MKGLGYGHVTPRAPLHFFWGGGGQKKIKKIRHVTCDTGHVTLRGLHGPSQGVRRGGPMRGLGSGHVTSGEDLSKARRCLLHRGQTQTPTDRQTDGHRYFLTESAQWADSVKSHHNKDNCVIFGICAVLRKTSRTNPISGCWSKYSTSFFETTTRTFHSTGRLSISNVRNA